MTTSDWWPADAPDTPESRLELLGWDAGWREASVHESRNVGANEEHLMRIELKY